MYNLSVFMMFLFILSGLNTNALLALNVNSRESLLLRVNQPIAGDYQRRIRNQELALQNKIDKNLIQALDNLESDPKAAEAALEDLANKAVQADGIEGNVDIEFYNSDTMTP